MYKYFYSNHNFMIITVRTIFKKQKKHNVLIDATKVIGISYIVLHNWSIALIVSYF